MRSIVLVVLLSLSSVAAAQSPPRLVPVIGLGLGVSRVPEPLANTCGGNVPTMATIEVMAGLARGAWRAELRTAGMSGGLDDCAMGGISHEGGVHTDRVHPYDRTNSQSSVSAHVQYAPARFVSLGVGAGSLRWSGTSFLLGSAAVRIMGRVALVAEVQARTARLRYDIETAEWMDFARVRVIASEERHEWHNDFAVRLGLEARLR